MPVLPRRRDEVREPVEELIRREFDDAVIPRTRGFSWSAGPDPVGRLMARQHVADAGDAAVCAVDHRKYASEWRGWDDFLATGRKLPVKDAMACSRKAFRAFAEVG